MAKRRPQDDADPGEDPRDDPEELAAEAGDDWDSGASSPRRGTRSHHDDAGESEHHAPRAPRGLPRSRTHSGENRAPGTSSDDPNARQYKRQRGLSHYRRRRESDDPSGLGEKARPPKPSSTAEEDAASGTPAAGSRALPAKKKQKSVVAAARDKAREDRAAKPAAEATPPALGDPNAVSGEYNAPTPLRAASAGAATALTFWQRHPDWSASILLLVVGFVAVATTYGGLGWSWDEAYYLPPARLAQEWAGGEFDQGRLSPSVLTAHWGPTAVVGNQPYINELPGLPKWIWAAGLTLFEGTLGTQTAMRLPSALLFALTLVVIYHLCRMVTTPIPSLFGAACFLFMPRVFGHAHFATTEMPNVLLAASTTYAFARGLGSRRWAIAAGLLFGLSLATKVNGFFLFPGLFLWAWLFERDKVGHPLAAMIFLAPAIFVLTWPWLWAETIPRILKYLEYHANNQSRSTMFAGQVFGGAHYVSEQFVERPGAPFTYPFTMIFVTTPPVVLAFMLLGLVRVAVARSCSIAWLFVIQAAIPILIIAAPGQPKYDGVRLFLPAYPFLAALCGFGLGGLMRQFVPPDGEPVEPRREKALLRAWGLTAGMSWAALLIGGVWAIASIHPYSLSYYNSLIGGRGGIQGAWDKGYEVTYWNEAINDEVVDWLNRNAPPNANIKTRAIHNRVLLDYQAWGLLRDDLRFDALDGENPNQEQYDLHMIAMRRGMWGAFDDMMFRRFPTRTRAEFTHQEVPMLLIWGPLTELGIGERRINAELGKDPNASPPPEY